MTLLLDLGNSRLKAGLGRPDGGLDTLGEAEHRHQGIAPALAEVLGPLAVAATSPVLCANVAGEAAGQALHAALASLGWPKPAFLRAQAEACGVRCAYPEPARLGADRWAALLGARGLTAGPCVVVDAGSALTIDAMAAGGRHLGGWILPGLAMMVDALEARTGDLGRLRRASADAGLADFPADTAPAMLAGARLAAAGAIERARGRLQARDSGPLRLFLTGGDAAVLAGELTLAETVPDLVLQGLARAAAFLNAG